MATATERALCIPEILELILLQLDMTDLLVAAQRVSSYWLTTIRNSPRLQQALFFDPVSSPAKPKELYDLPDSMTRGESAIPEPYCTRLRVSINPLLEKHFGGVFFNLTKNREFIRWEHFMQQMTFAREEDWLREIIDESYKARWRAYTRREASWRRMLVTQPPQPGLGYVRRSKSGQGTSVIHTAFLDRSETSTDKDSPDLNMKPGLRFGLVYDIVQDYGVRHHNPNGAIWIRVTWGSIMKRHSPFTAATEELFRRTSVVITFDQELHRGGTIPKRLAILDDVFRSEGCYLSYIEENLP
ncbi:uncharacterized protein BDV14DRAFT_198741 [Aspergillus stella-maris]|uniref:uncharacterized protein n=1 Tax=Aspergillus stella-maris TaxID=1810926 RepID=UPI003CCD0D9E